MTQSTTFQLFLDRSSWKTNSTNLYPLTKGYLRETCKSQNINPIYLLKFTFSVIQIITNACQVYLGLSLIKSILTFAQFQYLTFKPSPRGQVCMYIQSVTLHAGLHFFHFNLICNMTTFRKENKMTFRPHPRGRWCE